MSSQKTKKRSDSQMRIYSPSGERLYLNKAERKRFMQAVRNEANIDAVVFCTLLHYTGARPTELRELTVDRVRVDDGDIRLRTIKKAATDKHGNPKAAEYRTVPIPQEVMDLVSVSFKIRARQKKGGTELLWPSADDPKKPINARTVYRWVKKGMEEAGIVGAMATSKGLRHGFAVSHVMNRVPLHVVADLLGHSSEETTAIYTRVFDGEKRNMVLNTWKNNS